MVEAGDSAQQRAEEYDRNALAVWEKRAGYLRAVGKPVPPRPVNTAVPVESEEQRAAAYDRNALAVWEKRAGYLKAIGKPAPPRPESTVTAGPETRPVDADPARTDWDIPGKIVEVIRTRSKAWIFYLVLTVASVFVVAVAGPQVLIATVLLGLYTVYLYRGGRIVVFFF